jgi:hypothetical protein
MCFWIRTFRQLRAERWAFAILEHTRAFAHTARALLSKAQIIHESVLVDGGIKGECFILPESLLLALRRSMHHLILSYRGLVALTQLFTSPHNGNRSNGSDANEETEYLQEYLIRLEKVSKDAMTLFNEADEDLKSMAHPEDDHVARKYCAAGIESILICALTGLLDRPLAGYLSYTQPFDQQLTAIVSNLLIVLCKKIY